MQIYYQVSYHVRQKKTLFVIIAKHIRAENSLQQSLKKYFTALLLKTGPFSIFSLFFLDIHHFLRT